MKTFSDDTIDTVAITFALLTAIAVSGLLIALATMTPLKILGGFIASFSLGPLLTFAADQTLD